MVATKARGAKKAPDILDILDHNPKNDWQRLVSHVRENPVLWAAGAMFIVLSIVAGIAYRAGSTGKVSGSNAAFARAIAHEDAGLRAAELEQLAAAGNPRGADALYHAAEAAYQAKDYEKAKELFERVRTEHPQSEFTPNAVEGIGYVAENEGDLDAALAAYNEIIQKWPGSVARRRQEINIARVQERQGNFAEAVEAYTFHTEHYPESAFMAQVNRAMDRLRLVRPELFADSDAAVAGDLMLEDLEIEDPAIETPAQ